jgi:hypothetical protein
VVSGSEFAPEGLTQHHASTYDDSSDHGRDFSLFAHALPRERHRSLHVRAFPLRRGLVVVIDRSMLLATSGLLGIGAVGGWDHRAVDRRQVPADNVWVPAEVDEDTAVHVIASYFQLNADNYEGRALVLAYKDEADREEDNLAFYAANGNVCSPRSNPCRRGGPVLVIPSDLGLLDQAIRLADKQLLGVREYRPGSMSGWAAATGALNLATRERDAGIPDEIHQILRDLKREGNNGFPIPRKGV